MVNCELGSDLSVYIQCLRSHVTGHTEPYSTQRKQVVNSFILRIRASANLLKENKHQNESDYLSLLPGYFCNRR